MPKDRERRRRLPRRYLVGAVLVALVAGSERWGGPFTFETMQRTIAEATGAVDDELGNGREVGVVYLTFDDGPTSPWTDRILDVLDEHDARATFFPIGQQVGEGADALRRAVADGHAIGNHTWAHDRLVRIDVEEFDATIDRTQGAIEIATGVRPTCLRPPQGVIDESTRSLAASRGLSIELWTIDPQDWNRSRSGPIVDEVVRNVSSGDVVLLHDGGGDRSATVDAVDQLLRRMSAAGFSFEPLPNC